MAPATEASWRSGARTLECREGQIGKRETRRWQGGQKASADGAETADGRAPAKREGACHREGGRSSVAAEDAPAVEPIEIPDDCVFIGKSVKPEYILLKLANRHGLITGATGTGKTVTLQGLAESFSDQGVPVFCADVKGDLSGIAAMGKEKGWIKERAEMIGYDMSFNAHPVIFWDLFGKQGHPVRTTISELGPLLLSRLMDLSEAQEGVLNIAFRLADEEKLPLLDLKDLQSLLMNIAAASEGPHHEIRHGGQALDGRHSASAPCVGAARRRPFLRRAGAQREARLDAHRR